MKKSNDNYMVSVTWGEGEGTNGALSISKIEIERFLHFRIYNLKESF